jgi:hypothetical protein
MTDYDHIRKHAAVTTPGPPTWPTGVRSITVDGLTLLGIGPDNRLYFDGQQLEVSRTVRLSWWQQILATMTAVGTFAAGMAALLPLLGWKL